MLTKTLSHNLRMLRHKKGWKQKQVADLLHMTGSAYSKIETGFSDFRLRRLEQLADLYQISLQELLTGTEMVNSEKYDHLESILAEKDRQIAELYQKIIELHQELRV